MSNNGCKAGTAKYYMTGVQTLHTELGTDIKPLRMPLVKRTLKGIERIPRPPTTTPKLPITVAVLSQLSHFINLKTHHDRTLWAMMTLATYGLLRCGEITMDTHDRDRYPKLRHWNMSPDGALATFLPQSKNDPTRTGTPIFVARNNSPTCPVNAVHTMLSYHPAPLRPNSPLFSLDGSSPITRYGFLKSVSSLLSRAGLDSSQYSGHSFRRGGAQSAYDTGLPIDDLQLIGRWKSLDVARRYFGLTLHKLQSLSSATSSSNPSRPLRFESLGQH